MILKIRVKYDIIRYYKILLLILNELKQKFIGGFKKVRLDKYLKVSRLIKRRTIANEACDAGRISVNYKPAKASYDVKTGDIIEIKMGEKLIKVQVSEIKEHVLKDEAALMYKVL